MKAVEQRDRQREQRVQHEISQVRVEACHLTSQIVDNMPVQPLTAAGLELCRAALRQTLLGNLLAQGSANSALLLCKLDQLCIVIY